MQQAAAALLQRSLVRLPRAPTLWPSQLRACIAASAPQQQQRQQHPLRSSRSICAAAAADAAAVPLCRRPAQHVAQLLDLLSWRGDAQRRVLDMGDALEQQDGGPSQSELQARASPLPILRQLTQMMAHVTHMHALLQTELRWLTEDAVAAFRPSPDSAWEPLHSWQQLEGELAARQRAGDAPAQASSSSSAQPWQTWQVQLRVPLPDLQQMWRQRIEARVPYQYLACTAHWRDLVLAVGPGVLIPRPETELMVDLVGDALARSPELAAAPWLDLGTGSGALAVGVARALRALHQGAAVWAVDLSPLAASYAAANAAACGVSEAVRAVTGSWYGPVRHLRGAVGGIVSNPPYIPRAQVAGLQPEVARHEPRLALDGGPGHGMDSLEVICHGAADMLLPGGYLCLETAGGSQAERVQQLLVSLGGGGQRRPAFDDVAIHPDYYGVQRFVSAVRARE